MLNLFILGKRVHTIIVFSTSLCDVWLRQYARHEHFFLFVKKSKNKLICISHHHLMVCLVWLHCVPVHLSLFPDGLSIMTCVFAVSHQIWCCIFSLCEKIYTCLCLVYCHTWKIKVASSFMPHTLMRCYQHLAHSVLWLKKNCCQTEMRMWLENIIETFSPLPYKAP